MKTFALPGLMGTADLARDSVLFQSTFLVTVFTEKAARLKRRSEVTSG